MDGHERFKMGHQCRGGCQERDRITTFKKYILAVNPDDCVNLLGYFVDKSFFCHPECHGKPPWEIFGRRKGEGFRGEIPPSPFLPDGPSSPLKGPLGPSRHRRDQNYCVDYKPLLQETYRNRLFTGVAWHLPQPHIRRTFWGTA